MQKQNLKLFFILLFFLILPDFAHAYGAPNYLPDGAHPRIFLTSDVLTTLRVKACLDEFGATVPACTLDQDWIDLKASADTLLTYNVLAYDRNITASNSIYYSYEGLSWLSAAQTLGLVYKITGNVAYAAKLKELIDVINAAGVAPIVVDSGFASRSVGPAMAVMYDWLYDYLDAPTKAAMISTINAYYASFTSDVLWYNATGPAYDNYFGGHLLGFGLMSIATYGDNATAPTIYSDIKARWNNKIPAAFSTGGFAGGAALESYNYGPNHFVRLLQYGIAVQTSTGEDIYSSYGEKIAKNLLYNLKPNRWQSTDEGDMPGNYTGVMPSSLPIVLSGFTPGVSGEWMSYFYNNLAPTPYANATSTIQKADAFTRFLFKIPRTQTDYRLTEPLVFRSPSDEHVFIRTDWTDNAIWSSYAAGNIRYVGHETNKAGHIAIQRGTDYLLVNTGQWKGADGIAGTPQNFNSQSQFTNTLYLTDGGDYLYSGGASGYYMGGQMSTFPDTNAILNYETTAGYTYVKADHTNAYDIRSDSRNPVTRSLRYFYRNFVKIGDNTFVVFDRVKVLKDIYVKKIYWHLNKQGQPVVIDDKTISSTVGNSTLFIKSIFPTTSVVSTDNDTGTGGITTPRIEITDSVTSTDLNPLTVLIADGSSVPMPVTTGIDAAAMEGVIVENANPDVVLFSKEGTVQNAVSYAASYSSGTTGNHLLVDIEPAIYDVYRDGSKIITAVTASSQGVLNFSATGGTNFEIVKTGQLPVGDVIAPNAPVGLSVL
ncbi:MAG: hypothetical protein WCI36_03625 [bacterium]